MRAAAEEVDLKRAPAERILNAEMDHHLSVIVHRDGHADIRGDVRLRVLAMAETIRPCNDLPALEIPHAPDD